MNYQSLHQKKGKYSTGSASKSKRFEGVNHSKKQKSSVGKKVKHLGTSSESSGPSNPTLDMINRSLQPGTRKAFEKDKQHKSKLSQKKGKREKGAKTNEASTGSESSAITKSEKFKTKAGEANKENKEKTSKKNDNETQAKKFDDLTKSPPKKVRKKDSPEHVRPLGGRRRQANRQLFRQSWEIPPVPGRPKEIPNTKSSTTDTDESENNYEDGKRIEGQDQEIMENFEKLSIEVKYFTGSCLGDK